MDIGVIGGTGPAGSALAARLAAAGHQVAIGSRSAERASEVVNELKAQWPGKLDSLRGVANEDAAAAELVVMGTPWDSAAAMAAAHAPALAGKIVISMGNALQKVSDEMQALLLCRGSVAQAVQAAAPGAKVVAAFQHIPARELGALDHPVECDVLIAADDREAAKVAIGLSNDVPGCRGLYVGSLTHAGPIEAFTAVILQLNIRHKTRATLRLVGIDA